MLARGGIFSEQQASGLILYLGRASEWRSSVGLYDWDASWIVPSNMSSVPYCSVSAKWNTCLCNSVERVLYKVMDSGYLMSNGTSSSLSLFFASFRSPSLPIKTILTSTWKPHILQAYTFRDVVERVMWLSGLLLQLLLMTKKTTSDDEKKKRFCFLQSPGNFITFMHSFIKQLTEWSAMKEAVVLLCEWAFKGPPGLVGPFADRMWFNYLHVCLGPHHLRPLLLFLQLVRCWAIFSASFHDVVVGTSYSMLITLEMTVLLLYFLIVTKNKHAVWGPNMLTIQNIILQATQWCYFNWCKARLFINELDVDRLVPATRWRSCSTLSGASHPTAGETDRVRTVQVCDGWSKDRTCGRPGHASSTCTKMLH